SPGTTEPGGAVGDRVLHAELVEHLLVAALLGVGRRRRQDGVFVEVAAQVHVEVVAEADVLPGEQSSLVKSKDWRACATRVTRVRLHTVAGTIVVHETGAHPRAAEGAMKTFSALLVVAGLLGALAHDAAAQTVVVASPKAYRGEVWTWDPTL